MAVSFVAANAAYQSAARVGGASQAAALGSVQTTGGTFSDALASAVKSATETLHAGEAASAQGATGKGDLVQVVNAVTAAELTLQTVVAIRDRVIGAYQDIMKMPI
ncbi:MAG: flagellar hook-basal body complex protein FliE [Alphaproteobacteria bacterium]|jgi:flagellar hook-basal body complex protein FliE|nr:flagellar hook-basal body complex protein FliE [Alphaproteobacteria bacterium]